MPRYSKDMDDASEVSTRGKAFCSTFSGHWIEENTIFALLFYLSSEIKEV